MIKSVMVFFAIAFLVISTNFSACTELSSTSSVLNYADAGQSTDNNDTNQDHPTQVKPEDVLIKLSTDKVAYDPGETIFVTASVENVSSNSVPYTLMNIGDPIIAIWLENSTHETWQYLWEADCKDHMVSPMVVTGLLEPNRVVTRDVVWNQQLRLSGGTTQAPSGPYKILCSISIGDYYKEEKIEALKASIDIQITGSITLITLEQAKNIALSQPEVSEWVDAHSGKNSVKFEDGNYYVLRDGKWSKVAPNFHCTLDYKGRMNLDELLKWVPEPYVILEDGIYLVGMDSKLGTGEPNFVIVSIDSVTGALINVQFCTYRQYRQLMFGES